MLTAHALTTPVVVTVIDADGGKAVAGAAIAKIFDTDDAMQPLRTPIGFTDANGQIRLDCDPIQRTAFLITAAGRAPRMFGFWGCVPPEYRVALSKPEGTFSGRIVDGAGKPIADAAVRIRVRDYEVLAPIRVFAVSPIGFPMDGRTDSDGRFTVPSAPSVLSTMTVVAVGVELTDGWRSAIAPLVDWDDVVQTALRDGTFTGVSQPGQPVVRWPAMRLGNPVVALHLRVLDAMTNLPIAKVRVSPGGAVSPNQPFRIESGSALDLPGGDVTWIFNDGAWTYFLRVEADGYAAAPTRIVKASEGEAELEVKLTKATMTTLAVKTADGRPAAGVKAFMATPTIRLNNLRLGSARGDSAQPIAIAGADGILRYLPPSEPYRLAIYSGEGATEWLPGVNEVATLVPWATTTIQIGSTSHPIAGAAVHARWPVPEESDCRIAWSGDFTTDAAGRVTIPFCRANTSFHLFVNSPDNGMETGWKRIEARRRLKPGEHVNWSLMSGNTTVRATIKEYPVYQWSSVWLKPWGPPVVLPAGLNQLPEDDREKAVDQAEKMPLADLPPDSAIRTIYIVSAADGSVAVSGLVPGTYILRGDLKPIAGYNNQSPTAESAVMPSLVWYFVVPPSQPAMIDLGTVSPLMSDALVLQPGKLVPDLIATTLDGKPFNLQAHRGKWVLLDFWGTWCGFCIADEPMLKDAYEAWGRDGRLDMVSLSVDDTVDQVRQHVTENHLDWTQIVLGPREQTDVPKRFGVEGYPTLWLISPEGKLVWMDRPLRDELLARLGPPSPPATRP